MDALQLIVNILTNKPEDNEKLIDKEFNKLKSKYKKFNNEIFTDDVKPLLDGLKTAKKDSYYHYGMQMKSLLRTYDIYSHIEIYDHIDKSDSDLLICHDFHENINNIGIMLNRCFKNLMSKTTSLISYRDLDKLCHHTSEIMEKCNEVFIKRNKPFRILPGELREFLFALKDIAKYEELTIDWIVNGDQWMAVEMKKNTSMESHYIKHYMEKDTLLKLFERVPKDTFSGEEFSYLETLFLMGNRQLYLLGRRIKIFLEKAEKGFFEKYKYRIDVFKDVLDNFGFDVKKELYSLGLVDLKLNFSNITPTLVSLEYLFLLVVRHWRQVGLITEDFSSWVYVGSMKGETKSKLISLKNEINENIREIREKLIGDVSKQYLDSLLKIGNADDVSFDDIDVVLKETIGLIEEFNEVLKFEFASREEFKKYFSPKKIKNTFKPKSN